MILNVSRIKKFLMELQLSHSRKNFLYKFMPFSNMPERKDWILEIVKNNRIYIPSLSELNDPFELIVHGQEDDVENKILNKLKQYYRYEKMRNNTGVLSFSKNMNSKLLWAHYGDSFKGICIKFKIINKDELKEVNYFSNINKVIPNEFPLYKTIDWKYEKEVRYLGSPKEKIDLSDIGLGIDAIFLGINFESFNQFNPIFIEAQNRKISTFTTSINFDNLRINKHLLNLKSYTQLMNLESKQKSVD